MKMNAFVKALPLFLLPATAAFAGCGEGEGTCYYYKAGKLVESGSCQVSVCANVTEFDIDWQWDKFSVNWSGKISESDSDASGDEGPTVGGKPGYALPFEIKSDGDKQLICYGINGSDELVCNDTGVY